jgi:hypothetical protein
MLAGSIRREDGVRILSLEFAVAWKAPAGTAAQ